jgi:hypothetical protein
MTRGKLHPEARIDLHGMTLAEAHPELIRFILNAQSQGLRLVLVITGKGKRRDDTGPIPQRVGCAAPSGPALAAPAAAWACRGPASQRGTSETRRRRRLLCLPARPPALNPPSAATA